MSAEQQLSSEVQPLSSEIVSNAIERLTGDRPRQLSLDFRPLQGGLSAPAVTGIRAAYTDAGGRRRTARLVLKHLAGNATRERRIYEELVAAHAEELSPKLVGVIELSSERSALLLEAVGALSWPWRDTRAAQLVVERLASFHASTRGAVHSEALGGWDYDSMLERSAAETYERLMQCRSRPELSTLLEAAPAARRIVVSLRKWRQALLAYRPFGGCVLHGDVHPGNVLIRIRLDGQPEPVLIDWERARAGSALEDVSSWLQSLGFWEPEARRRHDTILASYLCALGVERRLTSELRAAYWIAGASNALAGALQHHLTCALASADADQRAASARAASSWLRVLRRADAFWS